MTLPEFIELCESNGLARKQYNDFWLVANISTNYMESNYWLLAYNLENHNTYLAGNIYTDGNKIFYSDQTLYSPTNFKNKLNIINGIIKSFKENEVNSKIKSIESDFNS